MLMIENKLDKMLKELADVIPENFGLYDNDDEVDNYLDGVIYDIVSSYYTGVQLEHGVSKYVIITEALPFVIKIPFNGHWNDEVDENEDYYFEEFHYANDLCGDGSHTDYCADELAKYELAESKHLNLFFAETSLYTIINEIPFYTQEKVHTYYNHNSSSTKALSDISEEYSNKMEELNLSSWWMAEAILRYGALIIDSFINFVQEYSLDEDMHTGNYGFRADGSPVLIDWSGWRD